MCWPATTHSFSRPIVAAQEFHGFPAVIPAGTAGDDHQFGAVRSFVAVKRGLRPGLRRPLKFVMHDLVLGHDREGMKYLMQIDYRPGILSLQFPNPAILAGPWSYSTDVSSV